MPCLVLYELPKPPYTHGCAQAVVDLQPNRYGQRLRPARLMDLAQGGCACSRIDYRWAGTVPAGLVPEGGMRPRLASGCAWPS